MSTRTGYSTAQIALHWLTAIAVVVAFVTHEAMEHIARETWDAGGHAFPTPHTIAGFLTLLFVAIRLWLRHKHGAPEPQGEGIMLQGAIWGHRLLYGLLLAVPVLGFMTWILDIRDLGEPHGVLGKAIMVVALGHAAFAIWHQVVKKDGTLMRMFKPEQR